MSRSDSDSNDGFRTDEISVFDVLYILWVRKWIIISFAALFLVLATGYAAIQPNIYRAQVLLAPASSGSGGAGSKLANQFGGLASIAGVNLGLGQRIDMASLAVEVMKSRKFQRDFIVNHRLFIPLLMCSGWDPAENKLLLDQELYDIELIEQFKKEGRVVNEAVVWDAYKKLSELVSITQSKDTGLITVSVEHFSPFLAKEWASLLVENINAVMKRQDLADAKKSIAFLEEQLKLTEISEMQKVLYELIEDQTKTVMFSSVREEYVFQTIDPALVPQEKHKPRRGLIVILFTMLGGILGVAFVLLRHFLTPEPK